MLVCGDVMLDKYWYGDANRISPEAPVPVVNVQEHKVYAGGAANVALNLAALGCQVDLLGHVGVDEEAVKLTEIVESKGVRTHFIKNEKFSTITKLRVMGRNQQLIRMDFEKNFTGHEANLIEAYEQLVEQVDVIILSDYAKGALVDVEQLIKIANQHKTSVLVDPKVKNFACYAGATLITPNRKEYEEMVGPCHDIDEIIVKSQPLMNALRLKALLVTLGKDGMLLFQHDHEPLHLHAESQEVYDVSGAGDTVIAMFSAVLGAGDHFSEAAKFANVAAGIVVAKLGVATVSVPELRNALQNQYGGYLRILTQLELIQAVRDAQAQGEKVVMTNGCFDILHAGHVQYLQEAKTLGHRLVIAVNSDESVRKLKGDTRPLNSLEKRMDVLSALRPVDWVVPFYEETPEVLISKVLPDVLVKGQDYKVEEIAGAKAVLENGGSVRTLALKPGCSTTAIIKKAKEGGVTL